MTLDVGVEAALPGLRVQQRRGDVLGVLVGVLEPELLGVLLVVAADPDREDVELGAGRHPAVGADLHRPPVLGELGQAEGAGVSSSWRTSGSTAGRNEPGMSETGTLSGASSRPWLTCQRSTP